MPHSINYKELMHDWVEDHIEPISEGNKTFTTVGVPREFDGEEEVIRNWLWAYAMNHSDEVLKGT